jgi:hypothetical protein
MSKAVLWNKESSGKNNEEAIAVDEHSFGIHDSQLAARENESLLLWRDARLLFDLLFNASNLVVMNYQVQSLSDAERFSTIATHRPRDG